MADTSMVDLVSLIEQRAPVRLKRVASTDGGEYWGNCPFCGVGTDRFHVWPNSSTRPHYWCRVCDAQGDAIKFLQEYENLSYFEACEELGIDPGSSYVRREHPSSEGKSAPCKEWRLQGELIISWAQAVLRSKRGAHALEYLHARGFTDEMIERYRIGYIPVRFDTGRWVMQTFEQWGLTQEDYPDTTKASGYKDGVWLYEGILIPCYEDKTLWKLTVRRLQGLKKDDPKYIDILGSSEGLFNVDAIREDFPAVICEGPLDALAGIETCGDLAAFVATGSTTRGRTLRWEMRLNAASSVLVAYDDDAPDAKGERAGDIGAKYWMGTLSHAAQWLPWAHDINEMLTGGMDLRAWLKMGIASTALELETVKDAPLAVPMPDEQIPEPSVPVVLDEAIEEPHASEVFHRDQEEQMKREVLDEYVRRYEPATLPLLPRKRCPHEVMNADKGTMTLCKALPLAHGWCEEHALSHDLLTLGASLGYPSMVLTIPIDRGKTIERAIGQGVANWEAYAECAPARWIRKDIIRIMNNREVNAA